MLAADKAIPWLDDDAPWREDAACLSYPEPNLFFATGEAGAEDVARAKTICAGCPVRFDCLLYAVETAQTYGVWGGTDADERRLIRRRWLAAMRREGFTEARRLMVTEELPRVLSTPSSHT